VPVHVDGTYVNQNDCVPAEEKAALRSLFQRFQLLNKENQKSGKPALSIGSVHVYVLTPAGQALDSLHVAEARPDHVADMLERAIRTLKAPAGKPLVPPAPQAAAPKHAADDLVLHLVSRYLVGRGQPDARKDVEGEFVPLQPALGEAQSGQWTSLPSEDWIVLKKSQWQKLLPAGKAEVGRSWEIDRELATEMLTRFYPTTENNDLKSNRIDRISLKATVLSLNKGVVRARIDGQLTMKHSFYPGRADKNVVEATIVGYFDFAEDGTRIHTLRLITDRATYGGARGTFGVALRTQ
jgi:hypothetical protein